ncbi:MAG: metalloprotease family protein [Anaerolineales bacterium]
MCRSLLTKTHPTGLAPFTVISLLGLLLIAVLPPAVLAWVFIPTVINAAASGGDFLLIHWMRKQPAEARYEDTGDALTAYKPL